MVYIERKRIKLFGLPFSFTEYKINEEKITITRGFLSIVEDDVLMYKIQDIRLTKSVFERINGLGTITCYTGDTTHPLLKLYHIKNANKIKQFIMDSSEEARRKRRTLHNMYINSQTEDVEDVKDND